MAPSPSSADRRANLIRELAQGNDRSRSRSSASDGGSARGDFQVYDTGSQQSRVINPDDIRINTSALKRAFPDFSQYGSTDDSSVEIGRGVHCENGRGVKGNLPSEESSVNISFDLGTGVRYQVTGTPPIKPRKRNLQKSSLNNDYVRKGDGVADNGSDKENEAKETRFGSATSSKESPNEQHGSRGAQIHSQAHNGTVTEGRPTEVNIPARNTRFGSARGKQSIMAQPLSTIHDAEQAAPNGMDNSVVSGLNGNNQSFMLPDMPNITELISGQRQDGTPLFSRSAKSRSKYSTPGRRAQANKSHGIPVGSAPTPTDEKALYVSLQLLQEKVAVLEEDKVSSEKKMEEYEIEVLQLKSKLEEREVAHHSDSGLGTDAEEAKVKGLRSEKTRLETSIKALQDRLEHANRKVSKADVTIQNLTKDRNAAHQQLAAAYLNSEELKKESQSMHIEIQKIRKQVVQLNHDHEQSIERLMDQEVELQKKIDRRERAIGEMGLWTKELWKIRNGTNLRHVSEETTTKAPPEPIQLTKFRGVNDESKNQTVGVLDNHNVKKHSEPPVNTTSTNHKRASSKHRHEGKHVESERGREVGSTTHMQISSNQGQNEKLSRHTSFMSFMEGDEIAKLRRIVKADRATFVQPDRGNAGVDDVSMPQRYSQKQKAQSIKDRDGVEHETAQIDEVTQGKNVYSDAEQTQNTRHSFISQRSNRHTRHNNEVDEHDMTSEFILPDITLRNVSKEDDKNMDYPTKHSTAAKMPQPLPSGKTTKHLTTRAGMSEADDATVRPSLPPPVALSTVIKSLESELVSLRSKLLEQETLYNSHDPALSKRKRKVIYAKIQKLLQAVEERCEMIYGLYDVFEGLKKGGMLDSIDEGEVEHTLRSVGMTKEEVTQRLKGSGKRSMNMDSDNDDGIEYGRGGEEDSLGEGSESESDLPWNGFETTHTQTLDNLGRFGIGKV